MPTDSVIDQEELFSRLSGDVDLLREVIELFKEEYPPLLADIEAALLQRDSVMLQNAAHSLKGAVAVFSARKVYDAALRMEMMGRNEDFTDDRKAFEDLKIGLSGLVRALHALDLRKAS